MIASIICGVITARVKTGSRGYSINWLEKQRATGRSGIDGLRSARQLGVSFDVSFPIFSWDLSHSLRVIPFLKQEVRDAGAARMRLLYFEQRISRTRE
jgi:hypothetical protein